MANTMPKNKSPLRYPGGKTRAVKILDKYIPPNTNTLLSPFLGGGSFEIAMHDRGLTVHANDLFTPLATFWNVAKHRQRDLVTRVRAYMPVSKEAFLDLRSRIRTFTDDVEIAAAYFVINRCSFSGATFCGGFSAEAAEKRLTESSLMALATLDIHRMDVSNMDYAAFLDAHPDKDGTFIYADPPYYIPTYIYGRDGDMHEGFDHRAFAIKIKQRKNWVLSYNDCPLIREMYADCRIIRESWSYGMDNGKKGSSEVVILPPLPEEGSSASAQQNLD
jgi:DNA adenine methylase